MLFLVGVLVSLCLAYTVSAQGTAVKAEASASQPQVGDTLTVNIKVSNAQNLYGVDVTLNWNTAVLEVVSAIHQLGVESHSGGVLHESSTYPITVAEDVASQSTGQYHLLASSTGASTPAFSGSGTIATVTFNVTDTGSTGLELQDVELSVSQSDGTFELVAPSTSVDSVNAVIPEFPTVTIVIVLVVIATVTLALTTKRLKNKTA